MKYLSTLTAIKSIEIQLVAKFLKTMKFSNSFKLNLSLIPNVFLGINSHTRVNIFKVQRCLLVPSVSRLFLKN